MGAVHLLPGTTFSNVMIRGDYDAVGRAAFTLRELEKWIAIEIAGEYHQTNTLRAATSSIGDLARATRKRRFRSSAGQNGFLDKFLA